MFYYQLFLFLVFLPIVDKFNSQHTFPLLRPPPPHFVLILPFTHLLCILRPMTLSEQIGLVLHSLLAINSWILTLPIVKRKWFRWIHESKEFEITSFKVHFTSISYSLLHEFIFVQSKKYLISGANLHGGIH